MEGQLEILREGGREGEGRGNKISEGYKAQHRAKLSDSRKEGDGGRGSNQKTFWGLLELDLGGVMNLTGFLICIVAQLSDRIFPFMYFRHFSSQSHVLSFSECLNTMPGVLVAGSKRMVDKNKEILIMTVEGNYCKLRNLSRCPDQISVEFCIIHFKSGLLK